MNLTRQNGIAAVELAILLIPLVLIVFGITEIGRAVYYYNTLLKGTRDAARYLAVRGEGEGVAEAKNLAVYGTTTVADTSLLPRLSTDNVPDPTYRAIGSVDIVTVTIQNYCFVLNFVPPPFFPGVDEEPCAGAGFTFTFGNVSTTMRRGGS